MLNFAVDDLERFYRQAQGKARSILNREDSAEGRFAWIMDPDGTKIELWQPAQK